MSYAMHGDWMVQVLRIGREKTRDEGTVSAAKRVDPIRTRTGLSRAAIIDRLEQAFVALTGRLRPGGVLQQGSAHAGRALGRLCAGSRVWRNTPGQDRVRSG